MKRSLILALLILSSRVIVLADSESHVVSVRQPLIKLVNRSAVEPNCGIRGVAACTAFVGERLDCHCEEQDGAWSIRPHAQFIPVMVISDATWVSHEREHVEDVREALEGHLEALQMRQFETSGECQRAAELEREGFRELMNRFKRESNAMRHPKFAQVRIAK
jgi:hypothetical protein